MQDAARPKLPKLESGNKSSFAAALPLGLRIPIVIFLVFALCVGAGGLLLFKRLQANETYAIEQNLTAIAQLKADQIATWVRQNKTNADVTARYSAMAIIAQRWIRRGAHPDSDRQWLLSRLEFIRKEYGFGEIAIADVNGKPILSTGAALPDLSLHQQVLRTAFEQKRAVMGPMHWDKLANGTPYISLPLAAPLTTLDEGGKVVGAMWIEIDVYQFLFPLIQNWPTASKTAETLIARQEGNNFLILNELRHQKDTALNMRIPVDHPDRLLPQALRGHTGLVHGLDYRGHKALGYLTPIAGTDWLMLAKVDSEEVYAPVRKTALIIVFAALALMTVSAAMLFLWWRHRAEQFKGLQLQSELNQQFLSQQFETISRYANDVILLLDSSQTIVDANDRAEETLGYPRHKLIGMKLLDLRFPHNKEELDKRWAQILQHGGLVFESAFVRSDGTVFPIEASARMIRKGSEVFVQSTLRDISERKNAEEREKRLSDIYHALGIVNGAIVHLDSEDDLFPMLCRTAVEYGGMVMAWVGIPNEDGKFEPVARYGLPSSYLDEVVVSSKSDEPEGQGPVGKAFRESRSIVAHDFAMDMMNRPWAEQTKRYGLRSASAFPIMRAGRPYAVFAVYSGQTETFNEEIVHLLESMAENVSFALDNVDKETARRRQEAEIRALFENASDGIFIISPNGQFIDVNERGAHLLSCSREDVLELGVMGILPKHEQRRLRGEMAKLNRMAPVISEWEFKCKDGPTIVGEVSVKILPDGRIIAMVRDVTERRRIEEALRDSEERYRSLFSNMTEGFALCELVTDSSGKSIDYRFIEVNDAFCGQTGMPRDQLERRQATHVFPRLNPGWIERFAQVVMTGEPVRFIEYGDDTQHYYYISSYRVDKNRFAFLARDITQQHQAEEALKESEIRFRQLADAMPQLVWTAKPDGQIDYTNLRQQEYAGIRTTDDGYDLTMSLHPDDLLPAHQAWQHALEQNTFFQAELRMQLLGNGFRWHISRAIPIRNEQGQVTKWFGTSTDIHELKIAQQAVQRSEERLRLAQQAAYVGTFEWDIRTGLSVWSPEAEALYGMESGSFGGAYEAWLASVHPDDRGKAEQDVKKGIDTGRYESEYRVIWPDGTVHWIASRGQVLNDEAGHPLRMTGVFIEITENKKAEARERRLGNMYRALSETNDAIIHLESETELFSLICRVAAEYGDMAQAWVGIPDENKNFIPAASYGRARDYLKEILKDTTVSSAPDRPEGRGPGGIAYREGRAVIVNDFITGAMNLRPWIEAAKRHGLNAASVFPIKRAGRSYAIYVIYSEQAGAFDEEIVHLLGEMAGNVSFALDNIDRENERRRAEDELRQAALVYHESAEAMMVTDEANRLVSVNPAFERLTGYKAEEVTGRNPLLLSAGTDHRGHYRDMLNKLTRNNYWQGELWLRKKNGVDFAAAMTINTTFSPDGAVNRHVALFSDITQRKQAEEIVWHQANFDTLTGLPNRRHFLDELNRQIRESRRSRLPIALFFLDLDGFKYVNDTLGHEIGDMLLQEAAERLKRCVRETDIVARLGGDEFTIILSGVSNIRHVEKVARHVLHQLAEPFELGNEIAHVSGSIGVTLYPQDASNIDDLLINADHAMYAAKEAGKNRYSFFTAEMQQAAHERTWLINELRGAIDKRQFKLVYQPIVELSTGCINKAEALLRWEHPERGLIDPSVFIPVAEESGMIQEIGDWVFFEAANQAVKWRQTHHPEFQISINKSPIQFKSRESDVARWLEALRNLELPGQAIAVEITEGVLMDESEAVTDQLLAFRDAGIEVSLDDFGTGYSSLSYLKRFDIDRLKIDKTFVKDLETNSDDQALCEAMIVMGHKLGIKVIAEGVETDRQRELLANAGCDFAQGFLLSSPVSAEELDAILKNGTINCPDKPLSN